MTHIYPGRPQKEDNKNHKSTKPKHKKKREEANEKFGFLMNAFKYGAPPHGGLAFGLDRLVSTMDGTDSIRDYIAFPKNNSGRDVMIDAPSALDTDQLDELNLAIKE